jgi:secreted PhoX family phosphatase
MSKNLLNFTKFISILALTTFLFSGCGNDDDDNENQSSSTTNTVTVACNSLKVETELSEGDSTCANGGKKVEFGLDKDSDNILDSDEITQTSYICKEVATETEQVAYNSLKVETVLVEGDTNCQNGGTKVEFGLDKDSDNILDSDEITSTSYVCEDQSTKVVTSLSVPTTNTDKNSVRTANAININGKLHEDISFRTVIETGTVLNGETFGLSKDKDGNPITFEGENFVCRNSVMGSGPDYTSILTKDDKIFMLTQFECGIGSMYLTEVEQDSTTGELTAKSLKYIDQSAEFGGWVHCAGMTTPWGSHLSSEEYEPDARNQVNENGELDGSYYGEFLTAYWGENTYPNPYYYGWTPEVKLTDSTGNYEYTKHYSMGRFSHELAYVMPDEKTVYLTDDGTNVGLFMFIADTAKDLTAGTLYGAKWVQTSSDGAGSADLKWINLGHSTDAKVRAVVATKPKFTDFFETGETNTTNGTCVDSSFTAINTTAGFECLKIKSGVDESILARLETRRYSAMKGVTTEFRKEEGITYDADNNRLYVAMSRIQYGMEDNMKKGSANTSYDVGGHNDIKLSYNNCGAVYALDVTLAQKDFDGTAINSDYVVSNMYGLISGEMESYDDLSPLANNSCNVNKIAEPDNVSYLSGSHILLIGEDGSYHENNYIWTYNVKTKELNRVLSGTIGSEATSPYWNPDINGFGYITTVIQHPFGELSSDDPLQNKSAESKIGYVGVFKDLNITKSVEATKLTSFQSTGDENGEGGSEIVAFDSTSGKMFITNGANNRIDVAKINSDKTVTAETNISLASYGDGINSVAIYGSTLAVASETDDSKGNVVFFNTDGTHLHTVEVGFLPDMVTFNEDGTQLLVANEGEPNSDYSVDPKGSIGIITVSDYSYTDLTFDNITVPDEVVLKPNTDASVDLEPEYITVSSDKAFVTLQENNALAIVNLTDKTIESVVSLGFKDYSTQNKIDIEENEEIEFKNFPNLYGMYQPDSIASYVAGDEKTYLVTANEGDGREYGDYTNEEKIKSLTLDSSIALAYADDNDLKVNSELGDTDGDGDYDELYTFGARSFSIWDESGNLVFDSGDEISELIAKNEPALFNQDDEEMDGRSGNKGGEPEALTVGKIGCRTYAFIGLERQSAILIYDITTPTTPIFKKYLITHTDGDISPEGMKFIPASESPTSTNLLLVANEMSSTTAIYEITVN